MATEITGMMIYYAKVCRRKLWYFTHQILMEQNSEAVQMGKVIDAYSYSRDEKHININDVINVDFIQQGSMLHEVKKSRKIEEASIWQVKYYLYYLKQLGLDEMKAKIDYPLLKQTIMVELEAGDEEKLEALIQEIRTTMDGAIPARKVSKAICKKCAYFDLCFV